MYNFQSKDIFFPLWAAKVSPPFLHHNRPNDPIFLCSPTSFHHPTSLTNDLLLTAAREYQKPPLPQIKQLRWTGAKKKKTTRPFPFFPSSNFYLFCRYSDKPKLCLAATLSSDRLEQAATHFADIDTNFGE